MARKKPSAVAVGKTKKMPWRKEIKKHWQLYVLAALPLIFLILFNYLPMYGIQIAFRDYDILVGIWESPWVGMKHFVNFINNPKFWTLIRNTLVLSLYSLMLFPLPIIMALMLAYIPSNRFRKTVQFVSYIPHFISVVVMCGMVIQFLDPHYGVINALIEAFGGKATNWMAEPDAFKHILNWSNVWQNIGYSSIIYIATLSSVSPELHEAATIDGANIWQRIWHVDLPGILPTVSVLLVMSCGQILTSDHERILLLQNYLNESGSEVITTYVYKLSFQSTFPQYSLSTAVNLFTTVINMAMLFVANKLANKISGNGMW